MKKWSLENLESIELLQKFIERFSVSITSTTLSGAIFNSDSTELILMDTENLDCERKVMVYDTVTEETAFTFESEGDDLDIITEIKKNIVIYLDEMYSKEGYIGGLVDTMVVQIDGCYNIEPNTIVFIKDKYKDIVKLIHLPDNKINAETLSGEVINISKDDFIDVGILE